MRLSFLFGLGVAVVLTGCNSFTADYIPIEPLGVHPNGTVFIGMESLYPMSFRSGQCAYENVILVDFFKA